MFFLVPGLHQQKTQEIHRKTWEPSQGVLVFCFMTVEGLVNFRTLNTEKIFGIFHLQQTIDSDMKQIPKQGLLQILPNLIDGLNPSEKY